MLTFMVNKGQRRRNSGFITSFDQENILYIVISTVQSWIPFPYFAEFVTEELGRNCVKSVLISLTISFHGVFWFPCLNLYR